MLNRCRRDQWSVTDLDWSRQPPSMPDAKERAVVQYFTDMAAIEHLAAALFELEARKSESATLRQIFESFVVDERRHAEVAARLARHYNVHQLDTYQVSAELIAFQPHFLAALEHLPPEIANAYVTFGEMLLDVALLRALDDYVDDPMSRAAMRLINRDESRHIAMDFHMTEYYSSDDYIARAKTRPRRSVRELARSTWAMSQMIMRAGPFLRQVFLVPMDRTDPNSQRLLEAIKRLQLLTNKPSVARLPFSRFILTVQALYNHRIAGPAIGWFLVRALRMDRRIATVLYSREELDRARRISFDDMAREVVGDRTAFLD